VLAGGFPRVLFPPCAVSPLWCFPPAVSGWGSVWAGLTPRLLSFDGSLEWSALGRRHARLGLVDVWPSRVRHSCTLQHHPSRHDGRHDGRPTTHRVNPNSMCASKHTYSRLKVPCAYYLTAMRKFRSAYVHKRVSTKSVVVLIIGKSKSNQLGAQSSFTKESILKMISLPLRNTWHPLPPQQQPARSGSHRNGDTPAAPKRRVGPVDGPPQPIWPILKVHSGGLWIHLV